MPTRFHIAVILTLTLCVVTPTTHVALVGDVALGVLLILIGLGVVFPQLRFFGPFICSGNNSHRRVALTFDDGPDTRSTPALLDWLREEKIEGTFFCIGKNVTTNRELTARIAREGHLLGNHTFNHSYGTNFFTAARLREELTQTQTAIAEATGGAPNYFRPPMGLSNPRTFRMAHELGLPVIGWSARGLDTQCQDSETVVARILRRVQPGGIILLHDGNIPAERLLQTVKLLVAKLRERDYEIVRLDKILT